MHYPVCCNPQLDTSTLNQQSCHQHLQQQHLHAQQPCFHEQTCGVGHVKQQHHHLCCCACSLHNQMQPSRHDISCGHHGNQTLHHRHEHILCTCSCDNTLRCSSVNPNTICYTNNSIYTGSTSKKCWQGYLIGNNLSNEGCNKRIDSVDPKINNIDIAKVSEESSNDHRKGVINVINIKELNNAINKLSHKFEISQISCNIYSSAEDFNLTEFNENNWLSERGVARCGWYYGKLSWREAEVKLQDSQVGSFLLRDSSDPRYCYSLSVQTSCGPTSVRIQRDPNGVSLDSDPGSQTVSFQTVHHLVQHYILLSQNQERDSNPYTRSGTVVREHVWLDASGSVVASISLTKPYKENPATLKHLARLKINQNPKQFDIGSLPKNLQSYVQKYPFWC
uniref:Suppressor of cytokine signaling 2-like n=1 Tax=Hirondellea gigas TaxID=1518452 RepID=A0A6A7G9N0_9CRUS